MSKWFKVKYKKLGKEKVYGLAHHDGDIIEMDSRLTGKKHMEILIHEALHLLWPEAEEEEIEQKAILLTNTMWRQKYRRIDDSNIIPLQDGSK
jgi:hypothetical protein